MLKQELDNLIAPATSTPEEWDAIENIYMNSDISKETAAKIWKKAYYNAWKTRTAIPTLEDIVNVWEENNHFPLHYRSGIDYKPINGHMVQYKLIYRDAGTYEWQARIIKKLDVKTGEYVFHPGTFFIQSWEKPYFDKNVPTK